MAPATEAPASITAEGPTSHTPKQIAALAQLRTPFDVTQISKLPKIWCGKCNKAQYKVCEEHTRARCETCQSNITTGHLHLDYVGHAELTGRLLDVDPLWTWEPLAFDNDGLPKFDANGGLWIRLTVCGLPRLGYGDAQGKTGPNAVKEAIGDALRNAGMRFGAALNLWSKTDMDEAHAQKEALSITPTPEARLDELVVVMQKRWGSTGGLNALRQQLEAEELAEAQVPDQLAGGTRLFGELVAERIGHLEQEAALKATVKRFLADVRKDWNDPQALTKRQAEATELGILDREVPGPTGAIVPIKHLLTQRLSSSQATTPPSGNGTGTPPAAPVGQPDEDKSGHVQRLMKQVSDPSCWNSPLALSQIKGDAEQHQVLDHEVQGPPPGCEWTSFRKLIDRRFAELKQQAENRNEGRSAA